MSRTDDQLAEVMDAFAEAVERDAPIRLGSRMVRVVHAALLDATEKPHTHEWQSLGWDRPGGAVAHVIQSCVCGEARSRLAP